MRGESGISLTGLYICGAISFVMLVRGELLLKLL
jgi:hypothetical protein